MQWPGPDRPVAPAAWTGPDRPELPEVSARTGPARSSADPGRAGPVFGLWPVDIDSLSHEQDLFGMKSAIIYDRLKIVFEACTYLLRFGGCRRFLAGLIDRHLVEK